MQSGMICFYSPPTPKTQAPRLPGLSRALLHAWHCLSHTLNLFLSPVSLLHSVVVQSLSCVQLFATPWTAACQVSLSFTISQGLLTLMSIELVMSSNCLILCRPLLLLPSVFPSIRVFSSELALLITWVKYWSISFNISLSNEYSGLISFRMDWCDLLAVQGAFKIFSSTTIRKCQCFGAQPSLWSKSHIHT